NVAAMYELTEMLIQRGYQNIGLLCANQEQWIFQQHLHGWYKAQHHDDPAQLRTVVGTSSAMVLGFSTLLALVFLLAAVPISQG
ncbi:LacI family transcriptional regulator, partial [Salmonella enterica subsp. enterica serovar Virginia]|nr:LacI family transcriptional regulator [Salmonella enterica subsp. enterica serovar Virginia]